MNCPNCGKEYGIGATFCPECGTSLPQYDSSSDFAGEAVDAAEQAGMAAAAAVESNAEPKPKKESTILPFDQFFKTLFNAAIKPFSGTVIEAEKFNDFANSAILAAIVIVALTILRTVTRSASGSILGLFSFGYFFLNFFLSLVMFAILTFGMAGGYYIAGSVIHEKYSYPRLLSIASMAVAPCYLVKVLVVPFISLIWGNLGSAVGVIATAYLVLMLYEGTRDELKLESDKRVYVNAICIGVILFISYLF